MSNDFWFYIMTVNKGFQILKYRKGIRRPSGNATSTISLKEQKQSVRTLQSIYPNYFLPSCHLSQELNGDVLRAILEWNVQTVWQVVVFLVRIIATWKFGHHFYHTLVKYAWGCKDCMRLTRKHCYIIDDKYS